MRLQRGAGHLCRAGCSSTLYVDPPYGLIWPKRADSRPAADIPEDERDYYLERRYPAYGNLAPRDIASRAAKAVCDDGLGVGPMGRGVYLDFSEALGRLGRTGGARSPVATTWAPIR